MDALLQGSGYALVIRDPEGNPKELHRLPPYAVGTTIDPITSEPAYRFNIGLEGGDTYSYRDVLHITPVSRIDGINGLGYLTGLAPIRTAREAIRLCIALEQHAARLMRSGGPSGWHPPLPRRMTCRYCGMRGRGALASRVANQADDNVRG